MKSTKSFNTFAFFAIAVVAIGFVSGCGRPSAMKSIPVEVVAATMDTNFASAPADTQDAAKDAVASLRNKDLPHAFSGFRALSERGDLTRDQRMAASAAFASTLQQTATAAAKGDVQARQVLKAYMASK
jgi:hypothetical protein